MINYERFKMKNLTHTHKNQLLQTLNLDSSCDDASSKFWPFATLVALGERSGASLHVDCM